MNNIVQRWKDAKQAVAREVARIRATYLTVAKSIEQECGQLIGRIPCCEGVAVDSTGICQSRGITASFWLSYDLSGHWRCPIIEAEKLLADLECFDDRKIREEAEKSL